MANVGFKLGLQSAVDALIAQGASAGATPGSFYLTSDTHRLYIGNDDTSIAPVNEGVITVTNISDLPNITSANKAAYAGRFYYVSSQNILCVFNGSVWAQINPDTYVDAIEFVVAEISDDKIRINNVVYNKTPGGQTTQVESDYLEFDGANGIKVDVATTQINGVDCHVITITGDQYAISAEQDGTGAKVKLTSDENHNSDFNFVPGTFTGESGSNVTFKVENGNVQVAAKDSQNASISIEGTTGFDISIKDNHNHTVGENFRPKIKYGNNNTEVDFVNGVATLDVYSKADIADTLKALNAMTYRGTIGTGGSVATRVNYNTSTKVTTVYNGSTVVQCSIGDVFLVCSDGVSVDGSTKLSVGTLLIAKGTEDPATGYITTATLSFDVVESTADTDTTYHFVSETVTNGGGISLQNQNSQETGVLQIKGDTTAHIVIDKASSAIAGTKGYQETLTIKHGSVTRTDDVATTEISMSGIKVGSYDNFGTQVVIPVVTGVTSDSSGHVTGITIKKYKIQDRSGHLSSNAYATSVYTKDGKSVGIIADTMGFTAPSGAEMTVTSRVAFSSESLKITEDDTNGITSSSSTTAEGLKIELVWGSFS